MADTDLFVENSPFEIKLKQDHPQLNFFAVIEDEREKTELRIKIQEKFKKWAQDKIKVENFDFVEEFRMKNQIGQMDASQKYGCIVIPYANCLFIFHNDIIHDVFEQNRDTQPKIFVGSELIKYIKLNKQDDCLAMQKGDSVKIYDFEYLLSMSNSLQNSFDFPEPLHQINIKKDNYIRQISFGHDQTQQLCLITDNEYNLIVYDMEQKKQIGTMQDIASAIVNQSGELILAAQFKITDHILVLNPQTLDIINKITLSFPEWIRFDVYRPFTFSDYKDKHVFLFASVFEDQEKLDDNFAEPLFFWIGSDINDSTTLSYLKENKKIKYYFQTDYKQQSDDEPPAFKIELLANPHKQGDYVGIATMSHQDKFFFFIIENDEVQFCIDYTGSNCPSVDRPIIDGQMIDQLDCFGTMQGVSLLSFKFLNCRKDVEVTLNKDDDCLFKDVPIILFYSADQRIYPYYFFNIKWKGQEVLSQPQPLPEKQSQAKQISPSSQLKPSLSKEETKQTQQPSISIISKTQQNEVKEEQKVQPSQQQSLPETKQKSTEQKPQSLFALKPQGKQEQKQEGTGLANFSQISSSFQGFGTKTAQDQIQSKSTLAGGIQQQQKMPQFSQQPIQQPVQKEYKAEEQQDQYSNLRKVFEKIDNVLCQKYNELVVKQMNIMINAFPNSKKLLKEVEEVMPSKSVEGVINKLNKDQLSYKKQVVQELKDVSIQVNNYKVFQFHIQSEFDRLQKQIRYSYSLESLKQNLRKFSLSFEKFLEQSQDFKLEDKQILLDIKLRIDKFCNESDKLEKLLKTEENIICQLKNQCQKRSKNDLFANQQNGISLQLKNESKSRKETLLRSSTQSRREIDSKQEVVQQYMKLMQNNLAEDIDSIKKQLNLLQLKVGGFIQVKDENQIEDKLSSSRLSFKNEFQNELDESIEEDEDFATDYKEVTLNSLLNIKTKSYNYTEQLQNLVPQKEDVQVVKVASKKQAQQYFEKEFGKSIKLKEESKSLQLDNEVVKQKLDQYFHKNFSQQDEQIEQQQLFDKTDLMLLDQSKATPTFEEKKQQQFKSNSMTFWNQKQSQQETKLGSLFQQTPAQKKPEEQKVQGNLFATIGKQEEKQKQGQLFGQVKKEESKIPSESNQKSETTTKQEEKQKEVKVQEQKEKDTQKQKEQKKQLEQPEQKSQQETKEKETKEKESNVPSFLQQAKPTEKQEDEKEEQAQSKPKETEQTPAFKSFGFQDQQKPFQQPSTATFGQPSPFQQPGNLLQSQSSAGLQQQNQLLFNQAQQNPVSFGSTDIAQLAKQQEKALGSSGRIFGSDVGGNQQLSFSQQQPTATFTSALQQQHQQTPFMSQSANQMPQDQPAFSGFGGGSQFSAQAPQFEQAKQKYSGSSFMKPRK